MPRYRVTWEVEVDAYDRAQAIQKAERELREMGLGPDVEELPEPDDETDAE